MDMFNTVLFFDMSGNGVPAMYLQLLIDLEHPCPYNWGAVVLAYLYCNLSIAARSGLRSIAGPLMLLQMWSWTRLNVSRPRPVNPFDSWGEPD